jgi:hypothetical protein
MNKAHHFVAAQLLLVSPAVSADDSGHWLTLMEAAAPATFERRVVDEAGLAVERQILEFEAPAQSSAVAVHITSFGDDGQPQDAMEVLWRRGSALPAPFMNAAMRFDDAQVSVDSDGPLALYPKGLEKPGWLDDVGLKVKIRKGLLSLLGTGTRISLSARRAQPLGGAARSENPRTSVPYVVTGQIRARVYVLGIPIKRVHYQSLECVDPAVGLIRHEMKLHDGKVAILQRVVWGDGPDALYDVPCGRPADCATPGESGAGASKRGPIGVSVRSSGGSLAALPPSHCAALRSDTGPGSDRAAGR